MTCIEGTILKKKNAMIFTQQIRKQFDIICNIVAILKKTNHIPRSLRVAQQWPDENAVPMFTLARNYHRRKNVQNLRSDEPQSANCRGFVRKSRVGERENRFLIDFQLHRWNSNIIPVKDGSRFSVYSGTFTAFHKNSWSNTSRGRSKAK